MKKIKAFLKSKGITKTTIKRGIRTFFQTAVGYIATNIGAYICGIDFNDTGVIKSTVFGLIMASVSAGLATVMNIETTGD